MNLKADTDKTLVDRLLRWTFRNVRFPEHD